MRVQRVDGQQRVRHQFALRTLRLACAWPGGREEGSGRFETPNIPKSKFLRIHFDPQINFLHFGAVHDFLGIAFSNLAAKINDD